MDEHRHEANETRGERQRSPVFTAIMSIVLMLPVLYVASIGPVARIIQKTTPGAPPSWAMSAYLPLIWLHDHTPLGVPLQWYVELWGG